MCTKWYLAERTMRKYLTRKSKFSIFSLTKTPPDLYTIFYNMLPLHSVEIQEILCHAKYFLSNQFIVQFFSKTLIWRKICEKTVAVKFRNFQCTVWKLREFSFTHFWLLNNVLKSWFDEIFFLVFPQCTVQCALTVRNKQKFTPTKKFVKSTI